jgi:hypothetical protein
MTSAGDPPQDRCAEHRPGAGEHPEIRPAADHAGGPDEFVALQLEQQTRSGLACVGSADFADPAVTGEGIDRAPDPVGIQLGVSVHDEQEIPWPQGRENLAQGLVERSGFPRPVPDGGHDLCTVQQAEVLGTAGAVVGDHDDPLGRARLPPQGRDGGIYCRGLVVGRGEDKDPAVPAAVYWQMIMLCRTVCWAGPEAPKWFRNAVSVWASPSSSSSAGWPASSARVLAKDRN